MGKIRIKTFDESSPEQAAKQKAKKEAKKALRQAQGITEKARVSGMGGGQRVKTVGPTIEEIEAIEATKTTPVIAKNESDEAILESNKPTSDSSETSLESDEPASAKSSGPLRQSASEASEAKKAKKEKFVKVKTVGKRHKENLTIVSKNQTYTTDQALVALKKFKKSKFDETVELHINVTEKSVSGQVTLPHGTGKTLVIKIADEAILEEVAKGKINFDVLVATPSMMPSLAKVAKVLGPKGLMPNPKNGTITDKPEEAVKKLSMGQVSYKTEPISPILHVSVGKLSFEDKKLKENIGVLLKSVGAEKINSVTLKSTMSPGIRLDYAKLA